MTFTYGFSVISTNFELEPVLKQYAETYPQGDLHNYRVVFRTEGEHQPESKSYIIVHEHTTGHGDNPSFHDFLRSYCTVHKLVAVANPMSHVLPDIAGRQGHVFGVYEKK